MKKRLNVIVANQNYFIQQGVIHILGSYANKEVNTTPVQNDKDVTMLITSNKYDLVISDTDCVDSSTVDILNLVRQNGVATPMLFISNCDDAHLLKDAYAYGHVGFVHSDCGLEEFNKAIGALLKGDSYYSHEASVVLLRKTKFPPSKIDYSALTNREREVLRLSSLELTTPEIAERLHLSVRTVEGYKSKIKAKFKSRTWVGVIQTAIKQGLIH